MSDTQTVDIATNPVASSETVAPPNQAGEPQGSTPATADTAASETAKPEGEQPDRQSRRASREFATQRREIRELHQKLGYLQAQLEQRSAPQPDEGQPQQRQDRSPAEVAAASAEQELNRGILERIEDAGDDIEGFDKVVETLTTRLPVSRTMRDFLGECDKPAEMAKWLVENPKEAGRISLLSDAVAVRALERAEAKLPAKVPPKTTKAPPPVPTVGGRSTANFDAEKASMEEYADHWNQRQAKR